jgi:hypothetical protein
MKHADSIEARLRVLTANPLPQEGRLAGKNLVGKGKLWVALDQGDHVHLLVPCGPDIEGISRKLSKYDQRFLTFRIRKWVVSGQPERDYLDVSCLADRHSEYRKPFIYFASDCVSELESELNHPVAAVQIVAQRWHRFWELPAQKEITAEWIKGLLGELWTFQTLVREFGDHCVRCWTGPDGRDHDFQATGVALEVKTTETMPPMVRISSLDQLDHTLFKSLWLLIHTVTARLDGETLPDVIASLESAIRDASAKEHFWQVLSAMGYRRHLEPAYREWAYRRTTTLAYLITKAFPSLTRHSLKRPLDERIQSIRYVVELSGLKGLPMSHASVSKALGMLCGASG